LPKITKKSSERRGFVLKSFISSKNEKLTEQAFSSGIITSVLSIVLCIAALCSTSWAWFTGSTESGNNEITTAQSFTLELVLKDGSTQEVDIINDKATLVAGQTYTVTISLPKDSASGYLVMTDKNGTSYRSDYILRHEDATAKTVTFYLTVDETQDVSFMKHWGIYTDAPSVKDGETLEIKTSN
jgi:hypothetical protein